MRISSDHRAIVMSDPLSPPESQELTTKRLAWQCRRGIKEVEVLLVPYFEQCYPQLSGEEKQCFERLLAQHDVELFEWFTTRSRPQDAALSAMVDDVLTRLAP